VQDHASSGCGKGLGDRCQIVDGIGFDGGSIGRICKAPQTFQGNEFSLMSNGNGSAGECSLIDAGAQDIKGTVELLLLATEGVGQRLRTRRVIGTLVQKMSSCCFCFRFITHSVHR
jgi:hypothetical protein